MFLYVFLVFIIILFLTYTYMRVKYGFWFYQPVFHAYNFYYYLFNIGIIRKHLPEKNKFTNFKNVETMNYEKISSAKMNKLVSFIQQNYFREKNSENIYHPKKENIMPYFINHSHPCYISFYNKNILLHDFKSNKFIDDKNIIGTITSRPLHVTINNKRKDSNFDVYYVDYLCVNKQNRKQNIAPQLIQTHEYNQSHLNKKISISLFKRENELTGIVPLTIYKTHCFCIKYLDLSFGFPPSYSLLEVNKQNAYYLNEFLRETNYMWDITILPDLTNINSLIESKNIWIYMLMSDNEIECVYIYRKTCTLIKKNNELLSLIASINKNYKSDDGLFMGGFARSLTEIISKNKEYTYLSVEDISHNNIILSELFSNASSLVSTPMAYFFYNFAYNPFPSNKVFILN